MQATNLTGSQAVRDEQHQDGAVALVDWPVALGAGQQALDILPCGSRRYSLIRVDP